MQMAITTRNNVSEKDESYVYVAIRNFVSCIFNFHSVNNKHSFEMEWNTGDTISIEIPLKINIFECNHHEILTRKY